MFLKMTGETMPKSLAILLLALAATPAHAAGDPAAGKVVFAKCAVCHSAQAGENRVGPSLHGVVGRKAGSLPDYAYSPAMKTSGLTWTPDTLDAYLTDPRKKLPGIKMIFAGLPNPQDRANLIAYLDTLK
jgi:cytochrome c